MNFCSHLFRLLGVGLLLGGFLSHGLAPVTVQNATATTSNPTPIFLDAVHESEPLGSIHGVVGVQLANSGFFSADLEVEATCQLMDQAGEAVNLATDPVTT